MHAHPGTDIDAECEWFTGGFRYACLNRNPLSVLSGARRMALSWQLAGRRLLISINVRGINFCDSDPLPELFFRRVRTEARVLS